MFLILSTIDPEGEEVFVRQIWREEGKDWREGKKESRLGEVRKKDACQHGVDEGRDIIISDKEKKTYMDISSGFNVVWNLMNIIVPAWQQPWFL